MPETPNCDSLPGVAKEISLIKGILEISHGSVTVLNTLTREPVLSFLKTSQIAHFACHGVVDAEDPSLSRLLLQDWKQRPLNVRTLLRTNGIGCQLVFLSACESAVGKDIKLREEGIHISGGFQMAGVPHVVGTLWRVDDQFGVKVAENFYQDLVGNNVMNIERSSKSLRRAVLDARASGADPLYWAAYIHSGP
jgi:CHAT domain-containing protein